MRYVIQIRLVKRLKTHTRYRYCGQDRRDVDNAVLEGWFVPCGLQQRGKKHIYTRCFGAMLPGTLKIVLTLRKSAMALKSSATQLCYYNKSTGHYHTDKTAESVTQTLVLSRAKTHTYSHHTIIEKPCI